MIIDNNIKSILLNWSNASDEDIVLLKKNINA